MEKEIPSIPGAVANHLGQIRFPPSEAEMPHGGKRKYPTKFIFGTKRRSSRTARHVYFATLWRGQNYKIHRLVCEAFHGPAPFPRAVVIHLNENALDNRPENLRWGTQKENLNMPGFIAYCRSRIGDASPRTKAKARNK
jgi:hypothetical protein